MSIEVAAGFASSARVALLALDPSVILYIFPILFWVAAATWVLWDSVQRAGEWGWLWGFFAFAAAPLVVPLYLVAIVIVDRPAPEWVQREKELSTQVTRKFKAMGELERVKFLEAAAGSGGTMYSGVVGMQPHDRGVKQFSDAHAEQLISSGKHAEAFLYLYDMYMLAVSDSDVRGEETYRHYLAQLHDGLDLLKRARDKQLSPGQLRAGGVALIESWTQPPDRSVRKGPLAQDDAAQADPASLPSGSTLERLLTETELAPPAAPGARPLSVKSARDPRAIKRPEVPF